METGEWRKKGTRQKWRQNCIYLKWCQWPLQISNKVVLIIVCSGNIRCPEYNVVSSWNCHISFLSLLGKWEVQSLDNFWFFLLVIKYHEFFSKSRNRCEQVTRNIGMGKHLLFVKTLLSSKEVCTKLKFLILLFIFFSGQLKSRSWIFLFFTFWPQGICFLLEERNQSDEFPGYKKQLFG